MFAALPAAASAATETVLHSFQNNGSDGISPAASLINVGGTLYGTAEIGGTHCPGSDLGGCGTVFSINPRTGAEKVLYSFRWDQDAFPKASLINVSGTLYGTTTAGHGERCRYQCGTVFSIDTKTGSESVVYSFCSRTDCADGNAPVANLIDVNGTLYGTTPGGGTGSCGGYPGGCGTVFSIDPKTGAETVLYTFTGNADGGNPAASLIDVNGTLYGTTEYGGTDGEGTVFSIKP